MIDRSVDPLDTAAVTASDMSVSDKIRALDRLGHPRAEIARLLGKRYQHVRNVLEADKTVAASGASEPGRRFERPAPTERAEYLQSRSDTVFRLVIRPDGSVFLPEQVLKAWGLGPGGVVMGGLDGAEFKLIDGKTSTRRAVEAIRSWNLGEGRDITAEFIADRRAEADREAEEAAALRKRAPQSDPGR